MEEVDSIARETGVEQDRLDKEARVIPKGTYEGTVFTWNKVNEGEKKEGGAYVGIPQYNVGVTLYDCPTAGEKKSGWFTMTTTRILNDKGNPKAAWKAANGMFKALDMYDQSFADVLEQAKVTRLRYNVGSFENDKGETVNFLGAVSTVR